LTFSLLLPVISIALLVRLIHWNVSVHGQSAEATVQPEIVKLKLDFLKEPQLIRRDDIPKSPPWVYPDTVQDPPPWTLWLGVELDRTMLCREVRRNVHWRLRGHGNPRRQELSVRVAELLKVSKSMRFAALGNLSTLAQ
jgi:hypothetical protein